MLNSNDSSSRGFTNDLNLNCHPVQHAKNILLSENYLLLLQNVITGQSNLQLFLSKEDVTVIDKIEILELAGSMILLRHEDTTSVTQAFEYWNEAMDLRDQHPDSVPTKVLFSNNTIVHWRAVEWNSKNRLQELQNSPLEYREQAILVAQRIFTGISSDMLLDHLWPHVITYLQQAKRDRRMNKILDVCWIMLESAREHDVRDSRLYYMIVTVRRLLVWVLIELVKERNAILTSETLQISLQLATDTDSTHLVGLNPHKLHFHPLIHSRNEVDPMNSLFELVRIVAILPPEIISHETLCCLHRLVKRDGRDRDGLNLFLLTSIMSISPVEKQAVFRLLIKVGADPNVTYRNGETVLHVVAFWMGKGDEHFPPKLADLLIKGGAHLDPCNAQGRTPLDLWKIGNNKRDDTPPEWARKTVPSLVCWSARSVRCYGLPTKDLPSL